MRSCVIVIAVMPRSYLVPTDGTIVSNVDEMIFVSRPNTLPSAFARSTS